MTERMTPQQFLKATRASANRSAAHSDLLKAAADYLQIQGWSVFSLPASPYGRNGMPDKVAIKNGRHVWLEGKTGKAQLSQHQRERHAELEMAGAQVVVFRSVEDLYVLGDERQMGVVR